MRRSTSVVSNRLADRRVRDQLARQGVVGRRVLTLPGVAARLAGGFARAASASQVKAALRQPPLNELAGLRAIAELPGFARAATTTLLAAWRAGVDLAGRAEQPGAHERWAELAALQQHVKTQLPTGTLLPPELVAAAVSRVDLAPNLLGDLTLEFLDDVPPLYRPLMSQLAQRIQVTWLLPSGDAPAWLPPEARVIPPTARRPQLERVSCADPAHEALEALRWVRSLLADGVPAADIGLAAADVTAYDDLIAVQAQAANLPLHAAHGLAALTAPAGQYAAAFAEALLRGPEQPRVRRLLACAAAAGDARLGALPEEWSVDVDPDAALHTAQHWQRALAPLAVSAPGIAQLLLRLVTDLAVGPSAAATVGEKWLTGTAKLLWQRALTEGPATALPGSLQRLRVDDGVDPAAAVVWGPASQLLSWPRPHVRLLGLAARSWPRVGSDEDPLLPTRILAGATLSDRSRARRDAGDLAALLALSSERVVLSRPRRGTDGRALSPSPLLRALTAGPAETELLPRHGTTTALHEADRRASRRAELAADASLIRARRAYRAAFASTLGAHDGLVRANHPALLRALSRRHSATSLKKLLLNPHGFVASYALGWAEPQPQEQALELSGLERGALLHEVLEAALTQLEQSVGLADADGDDIETAAAAAVAEAALRWHAQRPLPPPVAWRAELQRAQRTAAQMLTGAGEPLPNQQSYAELRFGAAGTHVGAAQAPWAPDAELLLPGTNIRLQGVIDRLDVDRVNRVARVVDYKSGAPRKHNSDLDGGQELQRTLYALAAGQLLGPGYTVEAGLLYAGAAAPVPLADPEAAIAQLSQAVQESLRLLRQGRALAGPGLVNPFEETLLAYPAAGPDYYYRVKGPALVLERAALDAALAGHEQDAGVPA